MSEDKRSKYYASIRLDVSFLLSCKFMANVTSVCEKLQLEALNLIYCDQFMCIELHIDNAECLKIRENR